MIQRQVHIVFLMMILMSSVLMQSCFMNEINYEFDSLINQTISIKSDMLIQDNSNLLDQAIIPVDQSLQWQEMMIGLVDQEISLLDMNVDILDMNVGILDMNVGILDMNVMDMQILIDGWDITALDTARNEPNFTQNEKDLIFHINQVRTNPRLFSTQFIEPISSRFQDNVYTSSNGDRYQTAEGIFAVQDCIRYLQSAVAVPPLKPSQALHQSAQAHARDSSMTGIVGHDSSNGTSFTDRLRSYLQVNATFSESISYGLTDPLEIVMIMMVDDGLPNRENRDNMRFGGFSYVGVACDTHPTYRSLCVFDFANVAQ
jgi:uncharacterized protein YkwD